MKVDNPDSLSHVTLELGWKNLLTGFAFIAIAASCLMGGYFLRSYRTPELTNQLQELSREVEQLQAETERLSYKNEQLGYENEALVRDGLASVTFMAAVGQGHSWLAELKAIDLDLTQYEFPGCKKLVKGGWLGLVEDRFVDGD
ncbi:MAG: hypothetical protein F6K00_33200 [Leptolyngbya sp. SIOISBB]|nr:hypothetical protein [Leptolyngbya sp. SIOISBB]